jgi:uncharacterized membrane protein
MTQLVVGLFLFFGGHAFSMARGARASAVGRFGVLPYKAAYSVIALAGFVLIVQGYAAYRPSGYVPVYEPPAFLRHVAALVMVPVFPLLFAAYLPGRIRDRVKHPMILAVKVWAFAHLLSNGDLGSILLFGSALAWAVVAFMNMRRRAADNERLVSLPASRPINDVIALVAGLVAYGAFAFWLHRPLIGVGIAG